MSRPPVAFIAWSSVGGRSSEISAELGGEARCFYSSRLVAKPLVPLRYVVSLARTVAYLVRRRPAAVIATNPPVFPVLAAYAYGRLARVPVLMDSHPLAFGHEPGSLAERLLPISRWLARRVASTLVTGREPAATIEAWGGRADVVHEAAPPWSVAPAGPLGTPPRVLFVGIYAPDEPVDQVIEAARRMPEVRMDITGDLRKRPPGLEEGAPDNVRFVGFLNGEDYRRAVEEADIVLTLTTFPTSVVRSGYEAVYAGRPLVVSDWPELRRVFPHAVHVANDADGIERGLREAVTRHADLVAAAPDARELQQRRWEAQLDTLRRRVAGEQPGLPAPSVAPTPGKGH
jgi:glycosyltransferase involved in cell wall biosynthesis